ncbi:MAG: sulfotransferase [Pseudomonadota bacterium]
MPAPVFLICSERSGSNLVSSILGQHSEVYAHPPYHMGRDLLLKLHDVTITGGADEAVAALKDNAIARVAKYRGDEEANRLREWFATPDGLNPHELARFVFLRMPEEATGGYVFVKENNLHEILFFLLDCFPDARFVFQVRDPRDYLLSALARRKRWLGNKFGSVRQALNIWRDDQIGGLRAYGLLGPERVHLQRYEDLVADFDATVGALCEFLDIEFDASMRDFHQASSAQQLAVKGGPRENLAKPIMADNFRKYRKGLSRGKIKIVEAYVGDLMDRFGYPRDYTGIASPSTFSVVRPQLSEPLERFINGEMRAHYKGGNRRLTQQMDKHVKPLLAPLWDDSAD